MKVSWKEFTTENPELAEIGENLLFQFGVGLAFLATVREDGGPRLHPVCPVLSNGRLFVLILPGSPKRYDLIRDGRFALQAFPPPREESEEFYITGLAEHVEDSQIRQSVFKDAKHRAGEDEEFFEVKVERVMHTTWENWGTPECGPVHKKWWASGGIRL
jgi:hypothetical protein